jgi:hypothetical protein
VNTFGKGVLLVEVAGIDVGDLFVEVGGVLFEYVEGIVQVVEGAILGEENPE